MTQIPASALSSSLTPLQRQQNDVLRARQVQSAKAAHHNEDVEELDDTGVDSIRDEQGRGNQQDENSRQEAEDKVDIQNLDAAPATPPAPRIAKPIASPISHLDISA